MQIIEKNTNDFWDSLIQKENPQSPGLFLQTWKWGEFQAQEGFRVIRLASLKGKVSMFQATIIQRPLWFGFSYLYCPRGPIYDSALNQKEIREYFLDFKATIIKLTHEHRAVFCKIEPPHHFATEPMHAVLNETSFIPSPKHIQPSLTQIIDLRKSAVELQSQCKPKTRYNIKVAQRSGIFIKEEKNVERFIALLRDTAKRDKFHIHAPAHYELMIKQLKGGGKNDPAVKLFFAYKNEVPIGTIMILLHSPFIYYLHGAFDYNYRSAMAPYLLHWHIMECAKKQKFMFYDLWGVDEKRWPGVTRFKEGFGGTRVPMPGSFDLAINKVGYMFYRHATSLRGLFS